MAHLQQWVSVLSECRHSGKCLYFIWLHPCGCEWIGPRSKPPTFLSFSAPLFPLPSPLPLLSSPSPFPVLALPFWFVDPTSVCGKEFLTYTTHHHPSTSPPLPLTPPLLFYKPHHHSIHFSLWPNPTHPPTSPTFKFPTINTQVLVLHCTLLLYNSHLPSIYDPFQNPKYLQSEALWMRSQTINSIKPSFFLPGPTSTIFLLL